MNETSPIALLLSVVPALAAIAKAVAPGGRRGLRHRLEALADLHGKLPEEGAGRQHLQEAIDPMSKQLAFLEDKRLRRHVDGAAVTAIVVVLLVGGGASYFLWQFDNPWLRVVAIAVAVFTTLLVTVGGYSTVMRTDDHYPFSAPAAEEATSKK